MAGEEVLLFVQGLLFPASHRFPDPGPAGAAAPRHPCVPRDRLGWCDRRERSGGDTATCPHSSLRPLCATFNCFVPWVASPAAQDPRRQRSRLFLAIVGAPGMLEPRHSSALERPSSQAGIASLPQTGTETPPSHSRFREAFGAISILPVPASSLPPHPRSPGWRRTRSGGQGAGMLRGMLTASPRSSVPAWTWQQTFIGGSPTPLAAGQAISWQGTGRGRVPHGGDRGMAQARRAPHSPPPPRPPNARAWWEAAGSFREEQKGPADLSILLGWCLGHLEDEGKPAWFGVGWILSPHPGCLHVHWGGGGGRRLGPLGAVTWDFGEYSPPRTGSPHLC